MILEAAILNIKAGQGKAFEAALSEALPLIEATPGFRGLEIRPCVEKPDQYLLLVRWDKLEDHTVGFREIRPLSQVARGSAPFLRSVPDRAPLWRAGVARADFARFHLCERTTYLRGRDFGGAADRHVGGSPDPAEAAHSAQLAALGRRRARRRTDDSREISDRAPRE